MAYSQSTNSSEIYYKVRLKKKSPKWASCMSDLVSFNNNALFGSPCNPLQFFH